MVKVNIFMIGFLTSSIATRVDSSSYSDIHYPAILLLISVLLMIAQYKVTK